MDAKTPTISVITATYNAEKYLPKLIESLKNQTDKDFEWVVADGGSTDQTLQLLNQIDGLNIKITSQADFGIYDAINRAIKASSGDFYIVIGADDYFFNNAIHDFKQSISDSTGIVTAKIMQNGCITGPLNKMPWLYGMRTYVSSHSVGTLFKKSLHEVFGYYSNKLPIAADNLFILKLIKENIALKQIDNVVGSFSQEGLSGTDVLGSLTENFRVQINMGSNTYLQLSILLLRLLKNIFRYQK